MMRHRSTKQSRRQCLAFIASATAAIAANRGLAALAAGQLTGSPETQGDGALQGLVDRCGLQDAPWLNARIAQDFERFRPGWGALRAAYMARCDVMRGALIERQQQGFTCPIADQIYAEARWLASATTDQGRILARFAEFDAALRQQQDQYNRPPIEQADDGSWAPYVTEPFHKLDISIDYINRIVGAANPILRRCDGSNSIPIYRRPLAFLKRWADPDAMVQELRDSQHSAIHRTGRWNRQKYASLLSSLLQLILKTPIERWLLEEVHDTTFTEQHKLKLLAFLDEAQDPCTGCWRDGYEFSDGTSHQAFDLSNFYHVVQYRSEGVKHWDAIADGLIAVRGFQYPQGPLGPARQADDHNDYDVVRIALRCLNEARPPISRDRSLRLQSYVRDMALGAVSRLDLNSPAAGKPSPYAGSVESYCYRVQLLDRVGFWGGNSRFLEPVEMKDRRRLAEAMLQRLIAFDDPAPMPVYAIALLRSYLGSC
jgi:hypothetical protein